MSESRFCAKCGAALQVGAHFCPLCGELVTPADESTGHVSGEAGMDGNTVPVPALAPVGPPESSTPDMPLPPALPPASPPGGTQPGIPLRPAVPHRATAPVAMRTPNTPRRLPWFLAIVGVAAALVCFAVTVFGFLFLQNQLGAIVGKSAGTPVVAVVPTSGPTQSRPVSSSPATLVEPREPSATATVAPATEVLPSPTATALASTKAPVPATAARRTATLPKGTATPVPGVYVEDMRFVPSPGVRGSPLAFIANYRNTTGQRTGYRVIIYVYRPGNFANSFGETAPIDVSIPVGSNDVLSGSAFRVSGGGGCEDFVARIASLGQDQKPVMFNQPNGKVFEKTFTVCP